MSEHSTFSANELLRLFLVAPSEAESVKFFDALVKNHALPLIEKVLRAKFGGARGDAIFSEPAYEDLRGECCLKIVGFLRSRKVTPDANPIRDFSAYSAAIVYNVWNAFVREHSPNRENLKNKIRYALDKDRRFTFESAADGENLYRLRRLPASNPAAASIEHLTALVEAECKFFATADLPDLLAGILEKADGTLKIEMLVKIVADLWQVRDLPAVSLDNVYPPASPGIIRRDIFEMRGKLDYLWQEIRALPVLQRVALLYNLRDERGGEMLYAFFNTRIATLGEIAEAMNLDKVQFAKLLPHLPFDDRKIVAAMNLTGKQIGNLRKVARDNLRRRLDGKAKRYRAVETVPVFSFTAEDSGDAAIGSEFLN